MINANQIRAITLAAECLGSNSALGRLCGVSHTAVAKWIAGDHPVAAEHVLTIERETGVSRHDLRPDIYPRDETAVAPPRAPVLPRSPVLADAKPESLPDELERLARDVSSAAPKADTIR